MNPLTLGRTIVGTLLAIVLSGAALSFGPEPHSFGESLGMMAILGGPGFLLLGFLLARHVARQEGRTLKFRGTVMWIGIGLGALNLLATSVVFAPFIGWWSLFLWILFLPAALAGGVGLGLGCLLGDGRGEVEE